jgi:hypothetical protein
MTWEKEDRVMGCPELVADYYRRTSGQSIQVTPTETMESNALASASVLSRSDPTGSVQSGRLERVL